MKMTGRHTTYNNPFMLSGFVNYTLVIDLLEKNTLIPLEITMFSFNLSRITYFSHAER